MSTYERKQLRDRQIRKQFIIFVAAVCIVSMGIGSLVTYALTRHISPSEAVLSDGQENVPSGTEVSAEAKTEATEWEVFGGFDDRIFTQEISLDWGGRDPEFNVLPVDLDPEIQEFVWWICKGYNLDYSLVMGLMWHESSFTADVISKTNDYGLMQINKINHEWLTQTIGVTDYLDPYQNIRAGTFILRKLFEKYQDPSMVLMAYNMGENGAGKLWKQDIYSTSYVESVLYYQRQIMDLMEQQKGGEG